MGLGAPELARFFIFWWGHFVMGMVPVVVAVVVRRCYVSYYPSYLRRVGSRVLCFTAGGSFFLDVVMCFELLVISYGFLLYRIFGWEDFI